MKAVEVVEISEKIKIFKEGVEAEKIEVVRVKFSDGNLCGFNIVSAKGLYEIGDEAILIQPDYCLSDISLFDSFIRPNGEINKSKLGKNNRIRAIKFNFSFAEATNPIYSFGILLPKSTVDDFIGRDSDVDDISEILGIVKYEEPESAGSGLIKGEFPSYLYKTDEENINNVKSHVSKFCDGNTEFGLTYKVDGSSFTQYFKKIDGIFQTGICSRSQEKKLEQQYVDKYINDGKVYHKYIHPETKIKGWFCDELKDFKNDEEVALFEPVMIEVKDSWVQLSKSTGLFERGMQYCIDNNVELVFRGEIYGQGLKGSGNKLNPDSKLKQGLKLFGVDRLESGVSIRQHYGDVYNLKKVCEDLKLDYTLPIMVKPSSYDELVSICEGIFKEEKKLGKIIEGIVIRTMTSNKVSCKYMNSEYDSKK